jgi:alkaline phosphatase
MKHWLFAGLLAAATFTGCSSGSSNPPKNVIFFLGDGMGMTTMTAARIYAVGEDGDLTMDTLPETAFIKTFSNDAQVADSAPSMAAYMTGVKMNNEVVSMSPETVATPPGKDATTGVSNSINNCAKTNGVPVQTLLEMAIGKGMSTGVVSTARLTHATPAVTYSHICNRNAEYDIARQAVPGGEGFNPALGSGVDVLMGGISQYWVPFNANGSAAEKKGRPDGRNLINEFKAKGYTFVSDKASFDAAPVSLGSKIIGLFDQAFTQGHMSYDLDRDPSKEPSLAEMTTKSMDLLSKKGKGYFLMVEGGRIDHALHETNAKRALHDTVAFDNAIKAAIAKAKETDPNLSNTLIVVTADHDHTLLMQGYSKITGKTTSTSPGILGLLRSYVDGALGKDADNSPFTILGFGNGPNRVSDRTTVAELNDATVSANDYLQESAIRTGTGGETHGGADVFLGAIGMSAEQFKGVLDNTAVFGLVRQALGL